MSPRASGFRTRRRANADLKAAHLRRGEAAGRKPPCAASSPRFPIREPLPPLNDATPILLMPVRIETRFQNVFLPGAGSRTSLLWVRIYPDDCWIDTFDAAH